MPREGGIAPCRASINSHTRSRTLLRASAILAMPWWPISFSDRHIVGTDETVLVLEERDDAARVPFLAQSERDRH